MEQIDDQAVATEQIQSGETQRGINVEATEIIFNRFPLTWVIPDEIVLKIYADLNQSSIRTRYSAAIVMSKHLQSANLEAEYEYFLNNPQIIQITRFPNEMHVNYKVPLLFESLLFLTFGNSLPLSFNYSNESSLQNFQVFSSDLTSQLLFPKRIPEVGPLLCLDLFHFRLDQMTDWEKNLLHQLIFQQKINSIGTSHGCIVPLIDLSSLTLAESCAFFHMKIAQFAICLTSEEIVIGSYVRELLHTNAKARIELITELIEYSSNFNKNDNVNESGSKLIRSLFFYCYDRLKDLRALQSNFKDIFLMLDYWNLIYKIINSTSLLKWQLYATMFCRKTFLQISLSHYKTQLKHSY